MAKINEVFEALKGMENGDSLSETLQAHLKELNGESASRRVENKEVTTELSKLQAQMKDIMSSLSADGKAPEKLDDLTTNRLAQEIKDLKDQFTKSETEKLSAIQAKMDTEKRTMISDLLRGEVSNNKLVADYSSMLSSNLELAEDGVLQTKDGIEAKKYISNFLEERKEIMKPNVTRGNIDNQIAVGIQIKDEKDMTTQEKFNAAAQRARAQLGG